MKIVRKPIDVVAIFKRGELPVPVRARMEIDGKEIVTKVDRIIRVQKQASAGKGEILYVCQSVIYNVDRMYELKYLIDTFQWLLYKI